MRRGDPGRDDEIASAKDGGNTKRGRRGEEEEEGRKLKAVS